MSSSRRVLSLFVWVVPSIVVGLAAGWLAGAAWPAVIAAWLVFLYLVERERLRRRLPERCRAAMTPLLDPTAGPPPGALPARLEAPTRWAAAVNAGDWRAARAILADDFVLADARQPERRHGRRAYMRGVRALRLAYPDLRVDVEEVRDDPAAADVVWIRLSELGHPARNGPALDATWWERWTLDAQRQRIRELELAGVTRLA
jgi:hypothetical protein